MLPDAGGVIGNQGARALIAIRHPLDGFASDARCTDGIRLSAGRRMEARSLTERAMTMGSGLSVGRRMGGSSAP